MWCPGELSRTSIKSTGYLAPPTSNTKYTLSSHDLTCGISLGGGKVVLPLLALGGIALWINYYYRRRPTVISQEEVDDTKEDYLSKLPDDVLSSILGNFTLRDAARTSILSTRWRYLFASTQLQQQPTFEFRCRNMFGVESYNHNCCPYYQEKDKFMNGLYQFLRHYSGRRVAHIKMVCCFAREFPRAFTHWFQSISRISVESLHLYFECFAPYSMSNSPISPISDSSKLLKFSLEVLSQSSSLKYLFLSDCIVLSSPKVHFNSLVTLTLRGVVLTGRHLDGILSSCSNLKKLTIEYSKLPYKLRLAGTITIVVIWECYGGKEVDLHAAYLHTLQCQIRNNARFFFSFVPMLENVVVCFGLTHPSNSYIFGDRARDLPDQVKSLTLEFFADQVNYFPIKIPTEMKTFRSLGKLSLILVTSYEILEIFEPSVLLGACPLLQNLSFMVIKTPRTREIRGSRRPPSSPTCHNELKQVTYGGFCGLEKETEFVLYILRSARVLEQMFLSPWCQTSYYSARGTNLNVPFDESKRNSIQQRLHGQAISRNAVVIIE